MDYVRGRNSWRFGMVAYGGWYNTDQNSNYLGTWLFADQASFDAGQAEQFTKSVGNPAYGYFNAQGALYVQDDVRISKSLTLSPGVRYSLQTHVKDYTAFEPRFGLTWSPFKNGKTTLRASAGTFHSWLSTGTLQQALLHDGQREQELLVTNATFDPADPGLAPSAANGVVTTSNKYLIGNYALQGNVRYSAGMDQVLSPRMRINLLYNYIHQMQLPRGENLNAPVDGVRPDPAFANVIETVTDGEIRRHEFYANFNLAFVPPSPAVNRPRFNWKRMSLSASYSYLRAKRNVLGAFDVPQSGSLDTEWGNGPADNPYRVNVSLNSTQLRNLSAYITFSAQDGYVYNETTGVDDNGDGIIADRPVGVGINTLRGAPTWNVNARLTYTITPGAPPPGVQAATPPRYRIAFFVSAYNLTNRANYTGYTGILSSQNFGTPLAVQGMRSVNSGFTVGF